VVGYERAKWRLLSSSDYVYGSLNRPCLRKYTENPLCPATLLQQPSETFQLDMQQLSCCAFQQQQLSCCGSTATKGLLFWATAVQNS